MNLLALATPSTTPRKTKMALKRDCRGRWRLLLHRSRPHFIYTNFFSQRSRPHFIYTNFFSQLHWPGSYLHKLFWPLLCTRFYLHKLFLATPVPPILSTQTFSRNSTAADSYYTNFFSQTPLPLLLLHKLTIFQRQRPATAYIGTFH